MNKRLTRLNSVENQLLLFHFCVPFFKLFLIMFNSFDGKSFYHCSNDKTDVDIDFPSDISSDEGNGNKENIRRRRNLKPRQKPRLGKINSLFLIQILVLRTNS